MPARLESLSNETLQKIADAGLHPVDCINTCSTCSALHFSILNSIAYRKAAQRGPCILLWAVSSASVSNGPSDAARKYLRNGGGRWPPYPRSYILQVGSVGHRVNLRGDVNVALVQVMQGKSSWDKISWLRLVLDNCTPEVRRAVGWDLLMQVACRTPVNDATCEIIKLLLRGGASVNGYIDTFGANLLIAPGDSILDVRWLPLGCLICQLSLCHRDRLPSGFNEAAGYLVPRGTSLTRTWRLPRTSEEVGEPDTSTTGDIGYLLLTQYRQMALPFLAWATDGWQERERPDLCELPRQLFARNAHLVLNQASVRETPLMVACDMGTRGIVKILLDANVDLDIEDEDGRTALMRTADPEIICALLKKGASLRSSWKYGNILHYYISLRFDRKYHNAIRLTGGVPCSEPTFYYPERPPLSKEQLIGVLAMVLAHGGRGLVYQKNLGGMTPLQLAMLTKDGPDVHLVRLLLDSSADVNDRLVTTGSDGITKTLSAPDVPSNTVEVIAAPLKASAGPHLKDPC